MRLYTCCLLLCLLNVSTIRSQPIQSLITDFERRQTINGEADTARGTIYYKAPHRIIADINYPVNQLMVFNDQNLTIYYPDEKRAFRMTGNVAQHLGFFQAFLGSMDEDFGLSELGFKLRDQVVNSDTLTTYWNPSKKLKKQYGEFTLIFAADRIIYAESRKSDNSVLSNSVFSDHIQYGTYYFPLSIHTTNSSEGNPTVEDVKFSSPQFNAELPDNVVNFKLPRDVKIEKIKW